MIKKSSRVPFFTLFIGAGMLATVQLTALDMDERIELAAGKMDIFKNHLQNNDLQIMSRNGMVRLSGTVVDAAHIRLASKAVASLPGVVGVINQLTEKSGGPAESTDQWLVNNVPSTLFFDQELQADQITVSAFDGMVMLEGLTGNATEKELAGTFTSDVRGFDLVVDNRTVAGEGNAAQ